MACVSSVSIAYAVYAPPNAVCWRAEGRSSQLPEANATTPATTRERSDKTAELPQWRNFKRLHAHAYQMRLAALDDHGNFRSLLMAMWTARSERSTARANAIRRRPHSASSSVRAAAVFGAWIVNYCLDFPLDGCSALLVISLS